MADTNSSVASGEFREAVCIDGGRVYDSCCDRDCLADLRCYFSCAGQQLVEQAINVRCREAEVVTVLIDVEPVHLNRGFYSCDMTFFFLVKFDAFLPNNPQPVPLTGACAFDKKVILYGSDGCAKVFSNENTISGKCDMQSFPRSNMPKCVVQCVDPVTLACNVCEMHKCCETRTMPACICERLGGDMHYDCCPGDKMVTVTLGLFTIVQLIRNVQMLIPVYDFCIPEKECENSTDDPCEVFGRLRFPTENFFPPRECVGGISPCSGCCGCSADSQS